MSDRGQELAARADRLLGELEAQPASPARDLAIGAVDAVVQLYGTALARIVARVAAHDADALAGDALVSSLLTLHDLHPEPLEARVARALDGVRPYLRSHGGDVELVAIADDVARVRLAGSCHGCAASAATLRARVERAVLEAAPELLRVEADGVAQPAAATPPIPLRRREAPPPPPAPATTLPAPAEEQERCDLCALPVPDRHRHLLDLDEHRLRCACRACATLFDGVTAGGRRYRLVPDRVRVVADGELPDDLWARLRIPVDLAFFLGSSRAGRVVAFYPGAMGVTESQLELETWTELTTANPVVGTLERDVEALLVDRTRSAGALWLVPVDVCYALAGVIRSQWRGLGGGSAVWTAIAGVFDELTARAVEIDRYGARRAAAAPGSVNAN